MDDMLVSGELAAAIGVDVKHPDVRPLIPNPLEAGLAALRRDGHYPINHLVVIKDELIAKHPDLAADVFNTFAESKRRYVERLKTGKIEKPTEVDKVHQRVMEITGDPLPYGICLKSKGARRHRRPRTRAGHHHQADVGGRAVCAEHADIDRIEAVTHCCSPSRHCVRQCSPDTKRAAGRAC